MQQDQKQAQLLMALDKIADRLIRMEQERDALRDEVTTIKSKRTVFEDALMKKTEAKISAYKDEQKRLSETIARYNKDNQAIEKRLDETDTHRSLISTLNQDNIKKALDESLKIQRQMRHELELNSVRQARLEEELTHSQQRYTSAMRKIEAVSTKYQRLYKRIDRVEQSVVDARQALQLQASEMIEGFDAERQALAKQIKEIPYDTGKKGFPKSSNLIKAPDQDNEKRKKWRAEITQKVGTVSVLAIICGALALGVYQNTLTQKLTLEAAISKTGQLKPDYVAKVEEKKLETAIVETMADEVTKPVTLVTNLSDIQDVDALAADPELPNGLRALELEALNGQAEAQHDLAALYSAGENGVPQNFEKAAAWFEKAAHAGVANAAYNLGVLYHQGLGVVQSIETAMQWYSRAAELNHPEAQYNLGIAHIEGVGTTYDPALAVTYFRQAAQGKIPEAAYNLGLILENGLIGEIDTEEAAYWYSKAAQMDNKSAAAVLKLLKKTADLSDQQLVELSVAYDAAYFADEIEPASGDTKTNAVMDPESEYIKASQANSNITLARNDPPMSPWQLLVSQVQGGLKQTAFYRGPEDGIYGPRTRDAIKAYEESNNLPLTGEPSEALLAHMRGGNSL
jgi:TPR repeat protein